VVRRQGKGHDRDPKRINKSKENVDFQGLSRREKKSIYVNQQESG
jgi:hypothetical protein